MTHNAERCCFALGPRTILDAIQYGICVLSLAQNDIHNICDRMNTGKGAG